MFEKDKWKTKFLIVALGQAVSLLGSHGVQFAMIWWLAEQTASPLMLGLSGLVAYLPMTLFSPLAGIAADRLDRKRICIVSDLAMGVVALLYALCLAWLTLPVWTERFAQEAAAIRRILGANCAAVRHIGSTAVPGLCAKPIIDILPVVYDLSLTDAAQAAFERIGYEYLGEFGIPGRRYLRKGGDERTHQIHILAQSDRRNIERHLAVRDYLRTHPEAARQYGALKTALAARFPYDIEGYCDGKAAFMQQLEREALIWQARGQAARHK